MPTITFQATLFTPAATDKIASGTLVKLPKSASAQLPSKGMVMVKGTMNNRPFRAPLEPDGAGSHWFKVKESLLKSVGAAGGDTVALAIEATKEWPEPQVPTDLQKALDASPEAQALWADITPMARWDWIRWVGATRNADTRKRRVESVHSRLQAGKRRPCCFDRAQCTLTEA